MLIIGFSGWALCRLATDPDPFDDPRGNLSSFRQLAYAGEPDLDRTIYFNNPDYVRPYCDPIGVSVTQVTLGGTQSTDHPLLGKPVDLIDKPALEGRNHVISFDGAEPIFPFHLRVGDSDRTVSRAKLPQDTDYPFTEYNPLQDGVSTATINAAVGRSSHLSQWTTRLAALRTDLQTASDDAKPGLEERIAMLEEEIGNPRGLHTGLFRFSMRWRNQLDGPIHGDADTLGIVTDAAKPWTVDLWFGGYDADAQGFYCSGTVEVPEADEAPTPATFVRSAVA